MSYCALVGPIVGLWLALIAPAAALELAPCFVPGQDCAAMVAAEIDSAKTEIFGQSYGLTHPLIIRALADARARGVDVRIILDRINESPRYTSATYLLNHGIEPVIDDRVAIAHNKVLVIDQDTVITGSMNFTVAAQKRNAENALIVRHDLGLAQAYRENWFRRAAVSRPVRDFRSK
jgi:phosphatidylserine/phosphatidylglycerophosphate/cardiolipin synthase-like enzyme